MIGEVPALKEDAPRCLAAKESSALKCATAASEAISAGVYAAQQAGAEYVNITPRLCTEDLCPAIIGRYLWLTQISRTSPLPLPKRSTRCSNRAINNGHA